MYFIFIYKSVCPSAILVVSSHSRYEKNKNYVLNRRRKKNNKKYSVSHMLAATKKSVISPKNYDKLSSCADFSLYCCCFVIFIVLKEIYVMLILCMTCTRVLQKASSIKLYSRNNYYEWIVARITASTRVCNVIASQILWEFVRVLPALHTYLYLNYMT